MTIERPMFPPRADSVHAFPVLRPPGDRPAETPPGDSPKAAGVLSRRVMLAGLAALPASAAASVAGPIPSTVPTELVAEFERLLDEYYVRRADWGPRLAQAHAETDELFGFLVDRDNWDEREGFFEDACDRLAVTEAHARMHRIGERMKPLARSIVALPTSSLKALRAKALVAFWQVAPLSASGSEFSFDGGYESQQLFAAVMEFCGITHKLAATGYSLPEMPDLFDPCDLDDEDRDEENA